MFAHNVTAILPARTAGLPLLRSKGAAQLGKVIVPPTLTNPKPKSSSLANTLPHSSVTVIMLNCRCDRDKHIVENIFSVDKFSQVFGEIMINDALMLLSI